MKKIKIVTDKLLLPDNSNITHTKTHYQMSTNIDFDKEDVIVYDNIDSKNLYGKIVEIDVDESTILYIRIKYYLNIMQNNEIVEKVTSWSKILLVNDYNNNFILSSSIVITPEISSDMQQDTIIISGSKFEMFSGYGDHEYTNYYVTDIYGNSIYTKTKDRFNLTNIELNLTLPYNSLIKLGLSYKASTSYESNKAIQFINNVNTNNKLFKFDYPERFVNNRKFYYRLKLYTKDFLSYDLHIVNKKTQDVVLEVNDESKTTNVLTYHIEDYTLVQEFEFKIRLKFNNKTTEEGYSYSDWKVVATLPLAKNYIYPYIRETKYCDKYEMVNDVSTSGIASSTMRETYDGYVIGTDFDNNCLWLYKNDEGTLTKIKKVFEFTHKLDVDYINVIQLPNHDVLVDTVTFTDTKQQESKFYLFDYNPIKQEFTLLNELVRKDERYNTAINNSLAVDNKGNVLYIPCFIADRKQNRSMLKLRHLDTETMTIKKEYDLPKASLYNSSIVVDKDDNFYIFCGSNINKYENEHGDRTEVWNRDNNEIYKFNLETESYELFTEFPEEVPLNIYTMHAFRRLDNKIIFFNATHSGNGVEYNKFITLDVRTKEFSIKPVNGEINVPFRNNIVFTNGDIHRISSMVKDPQKHLIYRSNTRLADNIPDVTTIASEAKILVVGDGEVVTIEDIYKYEDIIIEGDGLVRWHRPQGITILTSRDLIVRKDTSLTMEEINDKYESILILDGNQLEIVTENPNVIEEEEEEEEEIVDETPEVPVLSIPSLFVNDTTLSVTNTNVAKTTVTHGEDGVISLSSDNDFIDYSYNEVGKIITVTGKNKNAVTNLTVTVKNKQDETLQQSINIVINSRYDQPVEETVEQTTEKVVTEQTPTETTKNPSGEVDIETGLEAENGVETPQQSKTVEEKGLYENITSIQLHDDGTCGYCGAPVVLNGSLNNEFGTGIVICQACGASNEYDQETHPLFR